MRFSFWLEIATNRSLSGFCVCSMGEPRRKSYVPSQFFTLAKLVRIGDSYFSLYGA